MLRGEVGWRDIRRYSRVAWKISKGEVVLHLIWLCADYYRYGMAATPSKSKFFHVVTFEHILFRYQITRASRSSTFDFTILAPTLLAPVLLTVQCIHLSCSCSAHHAIVLFLHHLRLDRGFYMTKRRLLRAASRPHTRPGFFLCLRIPIRASTIVEIPNLRAVK